MREQVIQKIRSEFPITQRFVYLNHAGVGPTSTRVCQATSRWLERLAQYGGEFAQWREQSDLCRRRFADLIGASPGEVAFVRNTSHGLALIAEGLDWKAGDRIAVADQIEYPSNVHPWVAAAERHGLVVDSVVPEGGAVTPSAVEQALHPATRLLAVSSAQFGTGAVSDLAALGRICRDRGLLFCVDGIQTLGALPLDVKRLGVHFLAADSHKWLLGMTGIGALFVDESVIRKVRPVLVGWKSMQNGWAFDSRFNTLREDSGRFEEGSSAYPLIEGFSAALELLEEVGLARISRRIQELMELLVSRLEPMGLTLGPSPPFRHHILTLRHPRIDSESLVKALFERGFIVVARQGNLRVSPHFYNTELEIERFTEALAEILESLDSVPS